MLCQRSVPFTVEKYSFARTYNLPRLLWVGVWIIPNLHMNSAAMSTHIQVGVSKHLFSFLLDKHLEGEPWHHRVNVY